MKKIILIIFLFLNLSAFSQKHSPENTTQKLELKCSAESAYKVAFMTALEFSWEIKNSEASMFNFSAETPILMKRWDDYVNVFVVYNDSISTITVKSKLGHKPNVEYISLYLKTISKKFKN